MRRQSGAEVARYVTLVLAHTRGRRGRTSGARQASDQSQDQLRNAYPLNTVRRISEPPLLCGLPPVLPGGPIRALVLGSFPSVASLRAGQYYGNPQNWFWRMLAHCGVIQDPAAPYAERLAAVRRQGLAIWDLYARVRRPGSGDDRISDAEPNAVGALLAARGPFPILLNGRRAREWRRHFPALDATVFPLPSTSPRPRHWNTHQARSLALAEWYAALRSAGIGFAGFATEQTVVD